MPKLYRIVAGLMLCGMVFVSQIQADTNLNMSARVDPGANDSDVLLASDPETSVTLKENDEVTYTITYSSHANTSLPMTLEASWTKGTIEGTSNSVDALDYVIGSAEDADDGTHPTIDILNRKVTWEIPSVTPDSVEHTVHFKLKVKNSFETDKNISPSVNLNAKLLETPLPEQTLTFTIKPTLIVPTPTPTPISGSTPTPGGSSSGSTPTPTPTSAAKENYIKSVQITEISDTSVRLVLETLNPVTYVLNYGTSITSMNTVIKDATLLPTHTLRIDGLTANQEYFFTIEVQDANSQKITSDIFTFKTAKNHSAIIIGKSDLSVSSNKILLTNGSVDTIIIPVNNTISLNLTVEHPETIINIVATVQNDKVLGINTIDNPSGEILSYETNLVQTLPGVFSGEVKTPLLPGTYQIIFTIKDQYGGLYTKLSPYHIIVTKPLTIQDEKTKEPIENAKIVISRFNTTTKTYQSFNPSFSLIYKTNEKGELPLSLPTGLYKMSVSAFGYIRKTITFDLGSSALAYPHVYLKQSTAFIDSIAYYNESLQNIGSFFVIGMDNFFNSPIAKNGTLFILFLITIVFSTVTTALRMNVGIIGLFTFVIKVTLRRLDAYFGFLKKSITISTLEVNNYQRSIPGVIVYFLKENNKILFKTKTDLSGRAYVPYDIFSQYKNGLKLMTHRRGYYSYEIALNDDIKKINHLNLRMYKEEYEKDSLRSFLSWIGNAFYIFIADVSVIGAVCLSLFFVMYRNVIQVAPMLILTLYIIFIWVVYIKKVWQIQTRTSV